VLSNRPRPLYDYFKQLFAQVTNPPLDQIREELVTSMESTVGPERNLLKPEPESCRQIVLKDPILSNEELAKLAHVAERGFKALTLPMLYPVADGAAGLERAVEDLQRRASRAIADGYNVIILSDRGVNREKAAVPSLLATAAVHHHLVRRGERTRCGLVVETGDAREVHHMCLLIGYGAGAVNPWVAFETLDDMIREGLLTGIDHKKACGNFVKAASKGVIKVMSKMGISAIQSYRGAQVFEALGLRADVIDHYFTWTPSRVGGIGLDVIAQEVLLRHRAAYPERPVNGLADRAAVISAVEAVDAVISFDEETPIELIRRLRPDVLVKGGDYTIEGVVGAEDVHASGGRVVLVDLVEGHSTTRLIEAIRAAPSPAPLPAAGRAAPARSKEDAA